MSVLRPGLVLPGFSPKIPYTAIRPIRKEYPRVWLGRSHDNQSVILKEALNHVSYCREVSALRVNLNGHKSLRQLINVIPDGYHIMVLEHLDEGLPHVLHDMRAEKRLEEAEVKRIAKVVLQGLVPMHERGVAYTDLKAENIVVNFDEHGSFSNIKLINLGHAVKTEPPADFAYGDWTTQAPEALFGILWTTKVDIWALGTLIMWAFTGAKVFDPPGIDPPGTNSPGNDRDGKTYRTLMIMLQTAFFGPFPNSFLELSDRVSKELLDTFEKGITNSGGRAKITSGVPMSMPKDALPFLNRMMKLDPRQRPSAQELLEDPWLADVVD